MLTAVFIVGVTLGFALGAVAVALVRAGQYEKGYEDATRDAKRALMGKFAYRPVTSVRGRENGLRRDFNEVSDSELLEYTRRRMK